MKMRSENRNNDEKRSVSIVKDFMPNSLSSCLISCGNTRVLVTANVSDTIPPFLTGQNRGWLTAEYAMLPGSTVSRKQREEQVRFEEHRDTEAYRKVFKIGAGFPGISWDTRYDRLRCHTGRRRYEDSFNNSGFRGDGAPVQETP